VGEVTRAQIVEILLRDNKGARLEDACQYADAFLIYREAAENVRANGSIVLHPRTAAPLENPYLRVQAGALASMRKFPRLKNTGALWAEGPAP